ncbi:MAG: glycoside hydrolase family 28 protein, partial [Bacteroidales bacterium]|nr:glycoside hydrolase family 28 protein [Bacteroidales bacterium]
DIRDQAIVFETGYVNVQVGEKGSMDQTAEFIPEFSDITISNVICRDTRIGIAVNSTPEMVHDISLRHCTIFCSESCSELSEGIKLDMEDVRLMGY